MVRNADLTTLKCLEIWEPQTPGTLRACLGLHRDCFTFTCRQDVLNAREVE